MKNSDKTSKSKLITKGWKDQVPAIANYCGKSKALMTFEPKTKPDTWCSICNKDFSRYYISKHKKTHLPHQKQIEQDKSPKKDIKEQKWWKFNPLLHWETQYVGDYKCKYCNIFVPYLAYHIFTVHKKIFQNVKVGDQIKCHMCSKFMQRKNFGRHIRDIHDLTLKGKAVQALARQIIQNKQHNPPNYVAIEYNAMIGIGVEYVQHCQCSCASQLVPLTQQNLLGRYKLKYWHNHLMLLGLYYRISILMTPRITYQDLKYAYSQLIWQQKTDIALSTYSAIKRDQYETFQSVMETLFDQAILKKTTRWIDQQQIQRQYYETLQQLDQDYHDIQCLKKSIAQGERLSNPLSHVNSQGQLIDPSALSVKKARLQLAEKAVQQWEIPSDFEDDNQMSQERELGAQRRHLKGIIRTNVQKHRLNSLLKQYNPTQNGDFVQKGRMYEGLIGMMKVSPIVYGLMSMYVPKLPKIPTIALSSLPQIGFSAENSDFVRPYLPQAQLSYAKRLVLEAKKKQQEEW